MTNTIHYILISKTAVLYIMVELYESAMLDFLQHCGTIFCLWHSVVQNCQHCRSAGIPSLEKNAENFIKLYQMEWNTIDISATASWTLDMEKWNRSSILPLTFDVVALEKFLDERIKKSVEDMNKEFSGWRLLCEVLLISIIMFSRRQSGEVKQLAVSVYN